MDPLKNTDSDVLARAESLVREMQKDSEKDAENILACIAEAKESALFQEVGKMTRQLHDSLESFRQDSRIDALAETDIPDARERLTYVITMTQKSADRTLSAVENTMPLADKIAERAVELGNEWKLFKRRELSAEQFRNLSVNIESFLDDLGTDAIQMKENLNEVLMAQDYQDLTGQIIKKVINLVEEVEGNLVEIIRLTGDKFVKTANDEVESGTEAEGPHVPGVGSNDVMQNQDDVDDLLSSLGF